MDNADVPGQEPAEAEKAKELQATLEAIKSWVRDEPVRGHFMDFDSNSVDQFGPEILEFFASLMKVYSELGVGQNWYGANITELMPKLDTMPSERKQEIVKEIKRLVEEFNGLRNKKKNPAEGKFWAAVANKLTSLSGAEELLRK